MIRITSQEMVDFTRYIAEVSGIAIDQGKKYLLENRLQSVLDAQACNSFDELLISVRNDEKDSLRSRVIDAIATNETYFFRDQVPFDILRYKIVPDIIDRKRRQNLPGKGQIRVWCAGCSTGQEVYSVIMAILETVPYIGNYDIRVLGTDISSRVIAQASSGRYSQHEVERGLPPHLLRKYFVEENGSWRVRDEVRLLAGFRRMNLLEPFYGIGPFDIIFCRNVSIYFSEQNKIDLFGRIARILDRDGYLLVGGSESLSEVAPQFTCQRHLKGMFYQRRNAAPVSRATGQRAPSLPAVPDKEEGAWSTFCSPPAIAITGPVGKVTQNRHTARAEAGRKAMAAATVPAGAQAGTGVVHPKKPDLPADNRGNEYGRTPEAGTGKTGTTLFAGEKKSGADEPQTLLASILKRKGPESSLPVWERKMQGEGQRSLLESIRDSSATMAGNSEAEDE